MDLIRQGSRGDPVKYLQALLNVVDPAGDAVLRADGIFGPRTAARVRQFQAAPPQPLVADAVVGPNTWGKLQSIRVDRNRLGAAGNAVRQGVARAPASPSPVRGEEDAVMMTLVSGNEPPSWQDGLKNIAMTIVGGPLGAVASGQFVPIADALDEIAEDNNSFLERQMRNSRAELPSKDALDKLLYGGVYLNQEASLAGYKVLQAFGTGLGDMLRMGESVRADEFTVGNVARDGLRVISILPVGRIGRVLRAQWALKVPGKMFSCGPTALGKAQVLAGRILPDKVLTVMNEFIQMKRPLSNFNFTSVPGWGGTMLSDFRAFFAASGRPVRNVIGGSLQAIRQAAQRLGEPIILRLNWAGPGGTRGGAHYMVAHQTPDGVRFMDQFGDAWKLLDDGSLINLKPTQLGWSSKQMRYTAEQILDVAEEAIAVPQHAWVQIADHMRPMASVLQLGRTAEEPLKIEDKLLTGLMQEVYPVEPRRMFLIDAVTRIITRRPRPALPGMPGMPPGRGGGGGGTAPVTPSSDPPVIVNRARLRELPLPAWQQEDQTTRPRFYTLTVRSGDTLQSLSAEIYGNAGLYYWIAGANPHVAPPVFGPTAALPPGTELAVIGY